MPSQFTIFFWLDTLYTESLACPVNSNRPTSKGYETEALHDINEQLQENIQEQCELWKLQSTDTYMEDNMNPVKFP